MIEKLEKSSGKVIGFVLSGKLHDEDYKTFVPQVESVLAREGKARLLAHFQEFHGWDIRAACDDMHFGIKHYVDIEKIALVGDRKWEEGMAKICKPFTKAAVKYFDADDIEQAWAWLREEHKVEPKGENHDDQEKNPDNPDRIKEPSNKSVKQLIIELGNKDGMVRLRARQDLVHKGDSVVDDLIRAFQEMHEPRHFEAAKALSQIGSAKAIQYLIGAFDDEEFRVRWVAAEGLVAIGAKTIKPLLKILIKRSDSDWIRDGVHHVLHDLVTRNLIEKKKTEILQSVLDSYQHLGAEIYILNAAENALDKL